MKTLIINSSAEKAEFLADLLSALDAEAVSLVNCGNEELFQLQPEHSPLWQETQVEAIYGDTIDLTEIVEQLEILIGEKLIYSVQDVIEQDWVRITQASFKPIHIADRLSIYPSWHEFENKNPIQVRIDPGLAFGTGTHPTTQLCLEWLATNQPVGKTVIDYGCGSGILALSALALGASELWAVDHDPQALEASRQNSQLNHFELNTFLPEELPKIKVDLVLANILAQPLISLSKELRLLLKPSGILVLSGLLENETQLLIDCYSPYFNNTEISCREGWARLVFSSKI